MVKNLKVIIVGTGASGSAAAWNLSQNGISVTCFEQGPDLISKSYSRDRLDWEILKKKKFNPNPNIRKMRSDYPINDDNSPISIANFNAVGGSTILYNGHFPRFHNSDFKTKTIDNVGTDWPLSYEELKKFYDKNEKIIGVRGLKGDPVYSNINGLKPIIPLGKVGLKLANGFNKLNWHWWPSYSAYKYNNSQNYIRSTARNTYLNLALKNKVIIKKNSQVIKIVTGKKNRIKGVFYLDKSGKKKFEAADIFILAAGGIGTPRLLLASKSKKFPTGLANSSGLVGKNLMLHPLGYAEGIFKNFVASNRGPEGCCIASHEFYKNNKSRGFSRGYSMQVLRGAGPLEIAEKFKNFNKIKFGENFHKNFFKYFGKSVGIAIICEDLPKKNNSVVLDYNNLDENKMPGVKINYKICPNTKKMMKHGLDSAKKVLLKSGANFIYGFGPVRNTGWHIMGTAKMGVNPNNSVVDKFGKTHDFENLYVVDSSLFVTSAAVNCMSTIQALALKITDKIKFSMNSNK